MAIKFDFYKLHADHTVPAGSIEWDPETDSASTIAKRETTVLDKIKDKTFVVSPQGPEAAWIMGKPKTGGRRKEYPTAVVKEVHRLFVEDGETINGITFAIYDKFDKLHLKDGNIKSILEGKGGADVEGIDDLRKAAKIKLAAASTGRRKYTDKDKKEWERLHLDEKMSGSAIGKKFGINSSIINGHLREAGVQRNARGRVKAVKTS